MHGTSSDFTSAAREIRTVGIVGAGKLGTSLARLALAAGYDVVINARPKPTLAMILETVVPDAKLVDFETLSQAADIVILAVPHNVASQLDLPSIRGVIIDATNPWEATGTNDPDAIAPADAYPELPIARTLNHISYEQLVADSRIGQAGIRRAVAVWAADGEAASTAAELVRSFGFDPVLINKDQTYLFNADGRLFGAWLSAEDMREQLSLGK